MAELWVIGADKKQQFQVCEESTLEALPLAFFSGYGVIIYSADGAEAGKFGVNLTGYSDTDVSVVDETTFEVALDKSLNTAPGLISYQVAVALPDADYADGTQEIKGEKTLLYRSVY